MSTNFPRQTSTSAAVSTSNATERSKTSCHLFSDALSDNDSASCGKQPTEWNSNFFSQLARDFPRIVGSIRQWFIRNVPAFRYRDFSFSGDARAAEKALSATSYLHINGTIFIKKCASCGLARLQPVGPQIADATLFKPEPSHSIFLLREGGFRVLTPDTLPKRNGDLFVAAGDRETPPCRIFSVIAHRIFINTQMFR